MPFGRTTYNDNAIYDGGAASLETTFTIRDSDSDSLFSAGSHHLGQDDNDDRDDQTLLPLTQHANHSSTSVFSFETIPMIPLSQTQARGPELQKKVSFMNGLGLVIGMMIGSGLFSSPGNVCIVSGICVDQRKSYTLRCRCGIRIVRGVWNCLIGLVNSWDISIIWCFVLCRIGYNVTYEWW